MARARCRICGDMIGYGHRFYRADNGRLVHAACLEDAAANPDVPVEPGTTPDAPSARAAPRYPNLTAFCGAHHRGVVAIDWSGEDIQAFAYRDGWDLSDTVCFGAGATVDQALQQIEAYLRTESAWRDATRA